MYSDFLDEAAVITKRKALAEMAARYRELAKLWTGLAESMLPNSVKPFRRTKELIRKRTGLFFEKGASAAAPIEKVNDELSEIELEMREGIRLGEIALKELLEAAREKIVTLHAAESAAADDLAKAAARQLLRNFLDQAPQPFPGVDAGRMAVAPRDLHGVAADGVNAERMHRLGDALGLQGAPAGQFVEAGGAGALKAKEAGRIDGFDAVAPADFDVVLVGAADFEGARSVVSHGWVHGAARNLGSRHRD
jgi:hypothetical protein